MLENKTSAFTKLLVMILKIIILIWTLYLLVYLILTEKYNYSLNCMDKDRDKCESDTVFTKMYHLFHPFNYNRYQLPDTGMNILGGYINLGFIIFILVLSSIIIFSSKTDVTLSYKYLGYILLTIVCLVYHMINWISSM